VSWFNKSKIKKAYRLWQALVGLEFYIHTTSRLTELVRLRDDVYEWLFSFEEAKKGNFS
jgi:hypothetical protein